MGLNKLPSKPISIIRQSYVNRRAITNATLSYISRTTT